MQDQITLDRIKLLHPAVREEALNIYHEICAALTGKAICRFAWTIRTFAQQAEEYAKGRTKPGKIVTWAKAGESFHNYGLAIDIVLLKDTDGNGTFETASWETDHDFDGDGESDWREVIEIFMKHGWTAGINWNKPKQDPPHFEKTFGLSVMELLRRFNNKQVDANNYVKL